MSVSLIVVNYHSSSLVQTLLGSVTGVDEVILVDHSEDPQEKLQLEKLDPDQLIVRENRGYGAGLNAGAGAATGDVLIFSNPDILFLENAIQELIAGLQDPDSGVTGPRYLLQQNPAWFLPGARNYTWFQELSEKFFPAQVTRSYLKEQSAFWFGDQPVSVPVISGSVMASSKETFQKTGGFDERFFLFFEENDWCRRVRKLRLQVRHVPTARVIHSYGRTMDQRHREYHESSYRLFREIHYPGWYLKFFPNPLHRPEKTQETGTECKVLRGDWLLVSPFESFIPSACHLCETPYDLIETILPRHPYHGEFYVGVLRDGSFLYFGRYQVE